MKLQYILDEVIKITQSTGNFIRNERKKFSNASIEYKGPNDLVSYVDKESEMLLVEELHKILPEAGFIAEEGVSNAGKGETYTWVIDPLDGTTNFIHNLPPYAISIALIKDDEVILGVVYEITGDEMYYAIRDGYAYCNGRKISVSPAVKLSEALIATGFPYRNLNLLDPYYHIMKAFIINSHGLRRMGSASIDLVYVAAGKFEGYFEFNLSPWDVAAGALIVQQAGGKVTTFTGTNDYVFGREIIAGCAVQPEILETIQNHWQ